MPIIDLQRRLVEVGRIRMGEKRVSQGGKKYPARLDNWRLTSNDRSRLEAVASVYGGEITPWEGQFQVTTQTDALDIAVLPGQAVSQYRELWGQQPADGNKPRPVMCLRRCDGQTELLTDKPCVCRTEVEDDDDRACKPTTHLSVILRKIAGIGVWRVTSRGNNAANELAGMAELLEQLTARGVPVPARLRLDKRESVGLDGVVHHFVVPVIDIDIALDDVFAAQAMGLPARVPSLPAPTSAPTPGFTPVPVQELPPAPAPSLRDQLTSVGQEPRTRRSNAQLTVPSTGVSPRSTTAGRGGPADDADRGGGDGDGTTGPPQGAENGVSSPPADEELVNDEGARNIGRWCSNAGIGDDLRPAFLYAFSDGAYHRAHDVPVNVLGALRGALDDIKSGRLVLDVGDGTATRPPRLARPGEDVVDVDARDVPPTVTWKAMLARTRGVGTAKLLRKARELAEERGCTVPTSLEMIPVDLGPELRAWLDEQRAGAA